MMKLKEGRRGKEGKRGEEREGKRRGREERGREGDKQVPRSFLREWSQQNCSY